MQHPPSLKSPSSHGSICCCCCCYITYWCNHQYHRHQQNILRRRRWYSPQLDRITKTTTTKTDRLRYNQTETQVKGVVRLRFGRSFVTLLLLKIYLLVVVVVPPSLPPFIGRHYRPNTIQLVKAVTTVGASSLSVTTTITGPSSKSNSNSNNMRCRNGVPLVARMIRTVSVQPQPRLPAQPPILPVGFIIRRSFHYSSRQLLPRTSYIRQQQQQQKKKQSTLAIMRIQQVSSENVMRRGMHSNNYDNVHDDTITSSSSSSSDVEIPNSSEMRRQQRSVNANKTKTFEGIPIHMLNVTSLQEDDSDNDSDRQPESTTFSSSASSSSSSAKTKAAQLSWDKFEYSASPKIDTRFGRVEYNHTNSTEIPKDELLQQLHQQETIYDQQFLTSVLTQNQLWMNLLPETIQHATTFLQSYIQKDRIHRIQTVLQQRTKNVRFLFENPSNPSNVYACLRTMDAFGIQNVDIVTQSDQYRGKAMIYQKRNMRTAMGSAKWLTVTNYISTKDAIHTIRTQHNCRIYASDLNPLAVDIRTIDWTNRRNNNNEDVNKFDSITDQPICIVMGNEDCGISDTMRQLVDVTFTLPMVGFAESFNLSVATAIVLAQLSAMSLQQEQEGQQTEATGRQWTGPIRPGDLPEHEYNCLYLKALINSLPQKRMARGMLKTAGITLPKELEL